MHHTLTLHYERILFTLCCAIVFRGLPKAQDLTAPELLAPVGTSFHVYDIGELFPWDTLQGPGVTWDYAWTEVDSTASTTYEVIPLDEAPDADGYPDADRVVRSFGGTKGSYVIDRFFDVQSDRITELGSAGPVLSYVFDAPETVYDYPMALGDTVHGDYCFWSDGFGIQYHFCGESYVTFDAIGTLVLPYGTFYDVKHVTHWRSSFETTEPATDSTHAVRQQWFVPGVAHPVLDVNLFITGDGTVYPNGSLMDGAVFTGLVDRTARAGWNMWPNPTMGPITVQRTTTGAATIEVIAADGRVLRSERFGQGSALHQLSLQDLPDGIHLLRITDANGSSTQRVTVHK